MTVDEVAGIAAAVAPEETRDAGELQLVVADMGLSAVGRRQNAVVRIVGRSGGAADAEHEGSSEANPNEANRSRHQSPKSGDGLNGQ